MRIYSWLVLLFLVSANASPLLYDIIVGYIADRRIAPSQKNETRRVVREAENNSEVVASLDSTTEEPLESTAFEAEESTTEAAESTTEEPFESTTFEA
uniref:Secreted protein n=2 Tax=Bursaphelenchus xylophilus TaxID=6326 RepID=A0A1I7RJA0_BURXY